MARRYEIVGEVEPSVAKVASFEGDTIVVERDDRDTWLLARPSGGEQG